MAAPAAAKCTVICGNGWWLMVESIPKERWGELDFSEFGESEFPVGEIRGIVENGEIVAWYLREQVTHCGPFKVKPERQGYLGGLLIKDAAEHTPEKDTYIAATTEQSIILCRKMNMIEVEGRLFTR